MADIAITTTEVVPSTTSGDIQHGVAGEAITIGHSVYRKASDSKIYKAVDTSAAAAACLGIATSTVVAANQNISFQHSGTITIGASASITAGAIYVVTDTAGGISVESERGAGDYMTIIGIGNASNGIVIPSSGPFASGVAHA